MTTIQQGYGTSLQRDYATYTFTPNGQTASMTDARGYKASMAYDGFDRQTRWYFPSKTATGAINPGDYEAYTYDANGNRLSLRKRDGYTITYTYDNLNRVTRKTVPERSGLSWGSCQTNCTRLTDVDVRVGRFDAQTPHTIQSIQAFQLVTRGHQAWGDDVYPFSAELAER